MLSCMHVECRRTVRAVACGGVHMGKTASVPTGADQGIEILKPLIPAPSLLTL